MSGKNKNEPRDKPEAEAEVHETPYKHHDHGNLYFVRVGGSRLVLNLESIDEILLPVEGDPKQPLEITRRNGSKLQLVGDDADAFLESLGQHCDTTPCAAPKKPDLKEPPA